MVPRGGARASAADSRWCSEVVPDLRPENLGGARFSESLFREPEIVFYTRFLVYGAAGENLEAF